MKLYSFSYVLRCVTSGLFQSVGCECLTSEWCAVQHDLISSDIADALVHVCRAILEACGDAGRGACRAIHPACGAGAALIAVRRAASQ